MVVAEGRAEVAVENSLPVVDVLFAERGIKTVGVASGLDIGGRCAFAEHLLDGITGDQVDEQEDKTYYQPDYREGVENALEEAFQMSVLKWLVLSGRGYKQSVYIPITTGSDTTVPSTSTLTRTPISAESSPQARFSHSAKPFK